jgi:F0F1-type ATP synthase assembly protein I
MAKEPRRQDWMRLATAGTEFTVILCAMVGGGVLLDRWAGTQAVFTILGAFFGFAAATARLVMQARAFGRKEGKAPEDRPGNSGGRQG